MASSYFGDSDSDSDSSIANSLNMYSIPEYPSIHFPLSGVLRGTDVGRFDCDSGDPVARPSESSKPLISVTRRAGMLTMF